MSFLFCNIVEGKIPADIVYQDDDILAFRDINPQAPIHILCIPRKHIATANVLSVEDEAIAAKLLLTASKLAKQRVWFNGHAGQTVFHIHLHLLGGRHMGWPPD